MVEIRRYMVFEPISARIRKSKSDGEHVVISNRIRSLNFRSILISIFKIELSPNKVRFSCYFLNGGTPPDDYIDAYIKRKLYIKLSRVNGYWVEQKHTKSWNVIPRFCGKFTAVCRLAAYKIFTRKMLLNNSRRKLVTSFSFRLMCTGIYSMRTSELCMCVRDCGVAAGKYECESISYDAQKKISLFYLNAAEQVGRSMPK